MRKIRVLVANTPRLMRDLVLATLADQADVEVVGEVCEESEILNALERTKPDFLIISLGPSNQRPPICVQALEKDPNLRVVAIDPNRDSIMYYWLSPEIRSSRIETSEGGVLSALRGKVDLAGR
jgi:chemotaxis response regulator CheB